jgi:hypothetical protein
MSRFTDLVERWDKLPAAEAAARAWLDPGPQHGTWHPQAKAEVEFLMPMLARAMDRLVLELDLHPADWRLWEDVLPVVPSLHQPTRRGSRS